MTIGRGSFGLRDGFGAKLVSALAVTSGLALCAFAGRAAADDSLLEELTYGPAALSGGYEYVGDILSGELNLEWPAWSLLGTYLMTTDQLETLHHTFELGPIWRPSERWEFGGYLMLSPLATGQQTEAATGAAGRPTKVVDRLGADADGADLNASYSIGGGARRLTLLGETTFSHFDIDQSIGVPGAKGARSYQSGLAQLGLTGSVTGRWHGTTLSVLGSYFVYDQDPAKVGQISFVGLGGRLFALRGVSPAAAGLPSAPMIWTGVTTLRQQLGDRLRASFSYAYLAYVQGDGEGQAFTPKLSVDVTDALQAYAAYTLQLDQGASVAVGFGALPPELNLFTLGADLSF